MTHDPPLRLLQPDDPWATRPGPAPAGTEEQIFWPSGPLSLQDVVEAPARALAVEYKSWRNLRHPEDQAELARDIAALANHGGGAIAFGFDEESLAPADIDPFRTACDEAALEQVLRTFLDPAPRCELRALPGPAGFPFPVIRVFPHGAAPVFVRAHGLPPAGLRVIQPGAVYIRRHAPPRAGQIAPRVESAPVSAPADWLPIVRRCVRADRENLLALIEAAVEGRRDAPSEAERLRVFHDAARAAFLALAARAPDAERLVHRHHAFSYALDLARPEQLEPAQMPELLSRAANEVQQHIRIGARIFDPPYRRAVRPRFITDPALGDDEAEILETAWLRDSSQTERSELWRVSTRGVASVVRPYSEDEFPPEAAFGGPWLSPTLLARELSELVLHARAVARLFGSARGVVFRCEWAGLAGRRLHDPSVRWVHNEKALANARTVSLYTPAASLAHAWPEIAARLMAPVLRLIEPELSFGCDWFRSQAQGWK